MVLLRVIFLFAFASMVGVSVWAGLHTPLSKIPREVLTHPWFIATLLDAYWGFLAVYLWIAWKETASVARALWFIAVFTLGNIAIALYMLRELLGVSQRLAVSELLTARHSGRLRLPAFLAVTGAAAYVLA